MFDRIVIVDWRASATPQAGADSIWIGVLKRDIRFRPSFESWNPPTRAEAEAKLRDVMADLRRRNERALIGFDFNLGYPRGLGAALQLKDPSWAGVWAFLAANVVDKKDNTNNRFAVAAKMNRLMTDQPWPFWGCPPKDAQRWLTPTKPPETAPDGLPVYRHAETATHTAGKALAKPALRLPEIAKLRKAFILVRADKRDEALALLETFSGTSPEADLAGLWRLFLQSN